MCRTKRSVLVGHYLTCLSEGQHTSLLKDTVVSVKFDFNRNTIKDIVMYRRKGGGPSTKPWETPVNKLLVGAVVIKDNKLFMIC